MTDIGIMDVTDPDELAEELDKFSLRYARRTGDYEMAGTLTASAEWLRHLSEELAKKAE